ncbi:DgyrCDS11710 [Dimorphilus gyrociliatus]|uniref:DgyrCDS11710 n=1 Tax=Dimorphilus gyrociliatus TaxID=2664684 RepID=A0A7I8W5A0_9ANNE|nr:DgyrCDS11710 [Dimorphilus gyrociliatus]
MSTFQEGTLLKKLIDLNETQQSIQTLSLWVIHHRKHSKEIVQIWIRELQKAKVQRKLIFLYLANDIVQNSKKKAPELNKDFRDVMQTAYKHTMRSKPDDKTKNAMNRLLDIWKERGVFEERFIIQLKRVMNPDKSDSAEPTVAPKKTVETEAPVTKKSRLERFEDLKEEFTSNDTIEPPTCEELVKSLKNLENSASGDEVVRNEIAALPSEISDSDYLNKIKDKREARKLKKQVEDAVKLISDYNGRLEDEIAERKKTSLLIKSFISKQKEQLTEATKKLDEQEKRLSHVDVVRKELKEHIENLPDISRLPSDDSPLPSAGDLFNAKKELGLE